MNGIIIRDDESIERAMRRFTKTCERSGVLSELRKYRHFEKPSEEKKRKLNSLKQRIMHDKKKSSTNYEYKTKKR